MSVAPFDLVWAGNAAALDVALSQDQSLANRRHPTQASFPLHEAAEMDAVDVASVLIRHGADINARAWGLATPLHRAALNGSIGVCKLLVSKGADLDAMDERWVRPLAYAAFSSAEHAGSCARVLEAAGARTDLLTLVYKADDTLVTEYVQSQLDEVDQKLLRNIVPDLIYSWQRKMESFNDVASASAQVIERSLPTLDLLLAHGARIDGTGVIANKPAIFQAIDISRDGSSVLLHALLERNASVTLCDAGGNDALAYARMTSSEDAIAALLKYLE